MGLLAASEALAKGFRTLNGFATAQRQEEFQFKFSYTQINDLHICSVTSPGFCLETENHPTYDLILPLNGHSHSLIKGLSMPMHPTHQASLLFVNAKEALMWEAWRNFTSTQSDLQKQFYR
jgi:hypothetical protein